MKKLFRKENAYGEVTYSPLYRLLMSFTLLVSLMLLFVFLIIFVEKGSNQNLDEWFEGIWYGHAVFTTIGFGDVTPTTVAGKTLTMIFSIMGAVLIVSMGRSLDDLLFGHTETDIANVELRHYLEKSIELDERNRKLNNQILNELNQLSQKVKVLETVPHKE